MRISDLVAEGTQTMATIASNAMTKYRKYESHRNASSLDVQMNSGLNKMMPQMQNSRISVEVIFWLSLIAIILKVRNFGASNKKLTVAATFDKRSRQYLAHLRDSGMVHRCRSASESVQLYFARRLPCCQIQLAVQSTHAYPVLKFEYQ